MQMADTDSTGLKKMIGIRVKSSPSKERVPIATFGVATVENGQDRSLWGGGGGESLIVNE